MPALTEKQIGFFEGNGFLMLEDVLDRSGILAPLMTEYDAPLHGLIAGWVAEGRPGSPVVGGKSRAEFEACGNVVYKLACQP